MVLLLQQSTLAQAFRRWQTLAASLRGAKAAAHVLFSRAGKLDLSRVRFPQPLNTEILILFQVWQLCTRTDLNKTTDLEAHI